MKSVEDYIREDPITKQAMKKTGLDFESLMTIQLNVPTEDPEYIGGWCVSWPRPLPAEHISYLIDFAILRWYYSPESNLPENARWNRAASNFVHQASLGMVAERDRRRQEGTRKKRLPKITSWIERRLAGDPDAKSPELWADAPSDVTDAIGYHRFCKRVTEARKKLKGRK